MRKKKGSGKDLSVAKNMKVGNLEDKFEEEFGLKVQVAGSDDSYLCKDELTLNAAQQEDEKKLARKERKAARQAEASDDGDDEVKDENSVQYSIDYKDAEYASTIQWLSEDYKITDLVPYISAIICDGGEEYEELWGDDFNVISLDGFIPKEGDGEDTFVLCYSAVVEFDLDKFPKFKAALEFSSNQVEIKIGFKLPNGDDVDEEVCEGYSDIPIELKALVSGAHKEASDDGDQEDNITLDLDDYPESTHPHLSEIKRLSFEEKKSEEEIAEQLEIDEIDVTEAVMLLEMDIFEEENDGEDEENNNSNSDSDTENFKELTVLGSGGEIVIGTIKPEFVTALQNVEEDELNEEHIEEITGSPWSEIDDIWHFYGPFEEYELEDSDGNKLSCSNWYDWDWDESGDVIESFTKRPVKNLWKLSISERYLLIVVNGEKGNWGKVKVPNDFNIDQLQVISGDSEFDTEYCVTLGFSYLDNMLEWDEDGETRGSYREIRIFDTEQEEVILEF